MLTEDSDFPATSSVHDREGNTLNIRTKNQAERDLFIREVSGIAGNRAKFSVSA